MKRISGLAIIVVFLAFSAFLLGVVTKRGSTAIDTAGSVDARPIDEHAGHGDRPQDSAATRSFKEANERLHQAMNINWSDKADADFIRLMIAHSEGAVAMARIELDQGSNPEARALAEDMIRNRDAEILRMRIWLAQRQRAETLEGARPGN